jgi:hypothetical protein
MKSWLYYAQTIFIIFMVILFFLMYMVEGTKRQKETVAGVYCISKVCINNAYCFEDFLYPQIVKVVIEPDEYNHSKKIKLLLVESKDKRCE